MKRCLCICVFLSVGFYLIDCGQKEPVQEPQQEIDKEPSVFKLSPVQLNSEEIDAYVPSNLDHLRDRQYMQHINHVFDLKARELSSDINFIELTKAIAWTETRWRHYVKGQNRFFVIVGDSQRSVGIMQLLNVYHGYIPNLEDNVGYGVNFAYAKYRNALKNNCDNGSNQGGTISKIVRRAYAQYNGGSEAICRDHDPRDNHIEKFFHEKPWYGYF